MDLSKEKRPLSPTSSARENDSKRKKEKETEGDGVQEMNTYAQASENPVLVNIPDASNLEKDAKNLETSIQNPTNRGIV